MRLANYGLKDGKVFDFVSQTTPTGGQERNYARRHFLSNLQPVRLLSASRKNAKGPAVSAGLLHFHRSRCALQCASTASSSSATMLVILIIGLTAGPAVSL